MITILDNIKGLIFDLDGTLADTMPWHIESWAKAGKEYNVDITPAMIIDNAGTPSKALIEKFNRDNNWKLDPIAVHAAKRKHYHNIFDNSDGVIPIEPVYSFASSLRTDYPMCLATGSSRDGAMKSLESLNTLDWWTFIVTASDDIPGKPEPDIFLACAKAMNLKPEECMVFEDGEAGIQSAAAAGMVCVDVRKYIS